MFLHHLKSLDDSTLAKQVLILQDTNLLPGLVSECKEYIYRLPNILKVPMTHNEWKAKVKNMIKQENEKELKEQIKKSGRLRSTKGGVWKKTLSRGTGPNLGKDQV
jgi:hypothetical protein